MLVCWYAAIVIVLQAGLVLTLHRVVVARIRRREYSVGSQILVQAWVIAPPHTWPVYFVATIALGIDRANNPDDLLMIFISWVAWFAMSMVWLYRILPSYTGADR